MVPCRRIGPCFETLCACRRWARVSPRGDSWTGILLGKARKRERGWAVHVVPLQQVWQRRELDLGQPRDLQDLWKETKEGHFWKVQTLAKIFHASPW